MKSWKLIPALLAVAAILPACEKNNVKQVEENPDDSVKITYLGKGFDQARYGDIFQIETTADFRYEYTITDDKWINSHFGSISSFVSNYFNNLGYYLEAEKIDQKGYFHRGTDSYIYGILPEGTYKILVMEVDEDGKYTGICYTNSFTVLEYINFSIDGKLSPQAEWKAEYLGRYVDVSGNGNSILCDRFTTSGAGDAYYYHVICKPGSIKTEEDLRNAFAKGAEIDDLKGGEGLLDWYKMIAPNYNFQAGLDWLLAKGGKDDSNGYFDYTLSGQNTGTFDVYTVEMLLNGHITGKYGKTTLEITGTPDIKATAAADNAGKSQMRKMRL